MEVRRLSIFMTFYFSETSNKQVEHIKVSILFSIFSLQKLNYELTLINHLPAYNNSIL